ncbi:hypothetical protein BBD42_31025 [Paenibacillus sp. BIHB 4019]|uniref:Uncharacterized protein n=1 Tax=Paenibacillus sp. BIHB 4019 TaxID=1870819 RepID=A0A1B2DRW3_9BACL|nr:hypothetical protein [Paenibacillus sp. BIHB 4019]ANY70437.1 hypothetical protein BBD42_31025 [Paenibacillus sp. BIHB 4019]
MINTWWWQAIGAVLFAGMIVTTFLEFYEVKISRARKAKMPSCNWTFSDKQIIGYMEYSTTSRKRQRGIS